MKIFKNQLASKCLAVVLSSLFLIFPPGVFAQDEAGLEDLDVSLGDLLNLEVSVATKTAMTLEEAPSIVSVITGEEIKNMGARNLADVLRTIPGFDVRHTLIVPNHFPAIRGQGNHNTIKTMLNGNSIRESDGRVGFQFNTFPVDTIKRIEIIRGPGSALYGTDAFFGVINIITKEGGDELSELAFIGGSYSTVRPNGQLSYKDEDWKVYLYADYYRTNGYDGTIEADNATRSQFLGSSAPGEMTSDEEFYNIQSNISYKNFYFSGMFNKLDSNNPIGIARALVDEDEVTGTYARVDIGYKTEIADSGSLEIGVFYSQTEMDRKWEIFPEETAEMNIHTDFPEGESPTGNPLATYSYIGGDIQGDYEIYEGIQMVGGAAYEYWDTSDVKSLANYNPTGAALELDGIQYPGFPYRYFHTGWTDLSEIANWLEEEDRTITSLYAQGVFDLKKLFDLEKGARNLTLTTGVRYDKYDDMGSSTNPRFGLVYSPMDRLYFKALYGTAFRAPSLGELYTKNNPATTSNPDLGPEETETIEGLVGYNFTKDIKATMNYYFVKTDNIVVVKDRQYTNAGETEANGVEAEIKMYFGKHKYAYCNFTYQDVQNVTNAAITSRDGQVYTQEDFNPGSIPEIMANFGINYDMLDEHVILNVSMNYVGKRDRSEEMRWDGETLVRVDDRDPVSERTLFNASLTFRNFYKGLEMQISGFNLFDSDHRDPDPAGALYYDMPQSGRWLTGRISYSF